MTNALELTLQRTVATEQASEKTEIKLEEPDMNAYKNMETHYYLVITLGLYGIILVLSSIIKDVAQIFGFVSAFSTSFNVYTVPGLLYILADKKYQMKQDSFKTFMAWFYIFLGIVFFILELVSSSL